MADASRDIALVVEGGGMRGAYAAGAILGVHDRLSNRLGALIATSSGATSCAYAAAGQREGLDIWRDHLHGRRLIHPLRFVVGRAGLDVHYLIDTVFGRRLPLDLEALRRFPGRFEVTATRADTGEGVFFDVKAGDVPRVLKAAVSLPGAVRAPVEIDGLPYVDGGVVNPIPIERAVELGFRRIVLVLTRPLAYRKAPTGRFGRWLVGRDFPGLASAIRRQHLVYNETLDRVAALERRLELTVIRPDDRFELSRFTRSRAKLVAAVESGLADAARALAGPRLRPLDA